MIKLFKRSGLNISVFLTGAAVLVVEVTATRILSPYFGNTIYTVSSVIGVVLAALSVGYYLGGVLSDKYPKIQIFYYLIVCSGFSLLFLSYLNVFLLPLLGNLLSIISGPLITASLLFFMPSFILGMLSPFAVKLQQSLTAKDKVGTSAGKVFFWSTLGSIFGSLITGFYLIPHFGTNQIVFAVGLLLILLGLSGLILAGNKNKKILLIIFLLAGIFFLIKPGSGDSFLFSRDGIYEKISIYDGEYNGRPARFFQQDRSSSGAMYLDSGELVFDYTKYYQLYKLFNPEIRNALVIGGGAYSIPKALIANLAKVRVDVTEIEPSLFALAEKYFRLKSDGRIKNFTVDGRRFLNNSSKNYDYIFSDVYYSLFSVPAHFTSREFYSSAKNKLNQNGLFIANLIGDLSRTKPSLIFSEIRTFRTVFPNSYFFAVDSPAKTDPQNIIFVGYNSNKKIKFDGEKIRHDRDIIISSLEKHRIDLDRYELSRYPVLSDNYSPVDFLTAKVLKNSLTGPNFINGNEMLALIDQQLSFGPRYLSSPGHKKEQNFLIAEMRALMPESRVQTWSFQGPEGKRYELKNIIGRFNPENNNRIILATHYDSKRFADRDSSDKNQPVPGADDSASGVAVLTELARFLNTTGKKPGIGIDFVFFDGEEGKENLKGDYSDWKPLGSTYFSEHISELYPDKKPQAGIVLDMVCDRVLTIPREISSQRQAGSLNNSFWQIAKKTDSQVFRNSSGLEIEDDHSPLIKSGIPSILLIDYDYPYFHTTEDTPDKCSDGSLKTVAQAVNNYLYSLK